MDKNRGIIVAILLGIVAYVLHHILISEQLFSPGASTIALVLGAICAIWVTEIEEGGRWLTSAVMPIAIILLGFGLDLAMFADPKVGLSGLLTAFAAALTSLIVCYFLGKMMGLDLGTSVALGAGGAICGNSAVIAVAPSLKMKEENVAVVLSVINILGLGTFILIPLLSTILGLSETEGGIWAGAVIHAVPQAVAAGETIGDEGMVIATAIKLAKVSLLIFVVPLCAIIGRKINQNDSSDSNGFPLPYFVPGFVLAAILSTWALPDYLNEPLVELGRYMLLPLLAAVGFFINKESMKAAGASVLIVGTTATVLMLLVSYFLLVTLS